MDDLEIGDGPDIQVYVKNKTPDSYWRTMCVGYIRPANLSKLIAWLNTVDQDNLDANLQLTLGL